MDLRWRGPLVHNAAALESLCLSWEKVGQISEETMLFVDAAVRLRACEVVGPGSLGDGSTTRPRQPRRCPRRGQGPTLCPKVQLA